MNLEYFFKNIPWLGKVIGAFLGYLVAGPAGALIGIIIGNLFDRGLAIHLSRPHAEYHSERIKQTQEIFFEATFSVMGYIAKSDGRVSENELETARNMMDELRLSSTQQKVAKKFFNAGKSDDFQLERILILLKKNTVHNKALLRLFADFLYRMAKTDGLTEKKRQTLNRILQYLGFAPLHRQYHTYEDLFNQAYQQYRRQQGYSYEQSHSQQGQSHQQDQWQYNPRSGSISLNEAYALLGLSSSATKQEVKRAYRKLISQNHPDRLIAKGLPEAEIKKATDRTQKISKAYEQICTARGW